MNERRRFTDEEKLKILAEADEVKRKGGSLQTLADKYGLYTSAIYEWRKMVAKGRLKTPKTNGAKEGVEEDVMAELKAPSADVEILRKTILELEKVLATRHEELEVARRRAERAECLLALHKEVTRLELQIASESKA